MTSTNSPTSSSPLRTYAARTGSAFGRLGAADDFWSAVSGLRRPVYNDCNGCPRFGNRSQPLSPTARFFLGTTSMTKRAPGPTSNADGRTTPRFDMQRTRSSGANSLTRRDLGRWWQDHAGDAQYPPHEFMVTVGWSLASLCGLTALYPRRCAQWPLADLAAIVR
jgi:hypothetical protein